MVYKLLSSRMTSLRFLKLLLKKQYVRLMLTFPWIGIDTCAYLGKGRVEATMRRTLGPRRGETGRARRRKVGPHTRHVLVCNVTSYNCLQYSSILNILSNILSYKKRPSSDYLKTNAPKCHSLNNTGGRCDWSRVNIHCDV